MGVKQLQNEIAELKTMITGLVSMQPNMVYCDTQNKGGLEKMPRPLKYGQGCIWERNKHFNKALAKLAKEGIYIKVTPHCMRHTFITRCDELGINENASMSWTGHKTTKIHRVTNTRQLKSCRKQRTN